MPTDHSAQAAYLSHLMIFQESLEGLVALVTAHRDSLERAGFSKQAAEEMAVHLHKTFVTKSLAS